MDGFQPGPGAPPKSSGCSTLVIVLGVLVVTAGGGWLAWYRFAHPGTVYRPGEQPWVVGGVAAPANDPSNWDGTTTLECTGADQVTISGRTIAATASPAIRATGNCQLTLLGVTLTAPTPLEATGGAHVTVTGGALTGTGAAIEATGAARVDVTGTVITGPVHRSGAAVVTGVR